MADRSSPDALLNQSSTCPVQDACAEFLESHAAFLVLCEQDDNAVDVAVGLERRRLAMALVRAQTARSSKAIVAKTRVLQTVVEARGDDADADVTEFTLEVLQEMIQFCAGETCSCSQSNHIRGQAGAPEGEPDHQLQIT